MIPKSGDRFSEKIMLEQRASARRFFFQRRVRSCRVHDPPADHVSSASSAPISATCAGLTWESAAPAWRERLGQRGSALATGGREREEIDHASVGLKPAMARDGATTSI